MDVADIREQFEWMENEWAPNRAEGDEDMRYVAGDGWEPEARRVRDLAKRPCLWFDELGQYFNQLINDARANPRAVKFDPIGNGADEDGATFYADKMREIEYRSRAQIAYTTALENSVQRGYGWVRVSTRYGASDEQELWIDAVPNPNMVLPDPESRSPNSRDMKRLIFYEAWRQKDFQRKFPKATISDFASHVAVAPRWVGVETILLAEYWTINTTRRRKVFVQTIGNGSAPQWVFADDLATRSEGLVVLGERDIDVPSVSQYLTNGLEILEETAWPGTHIPFSSCFGKVLYTDEGTGSKRTLLSMTRLARHPAMLYSYYRTCEAELVGMTPKFPYFVRRGSLKPEELEALQRSLQEPVAAIEVENFVEGRLTNDPPEFPQRQPFEPPIQALEIGAESARRGIQAAMGISPLPTEAQRQNLKSGVALQRIESASQRGSYHFLDGYDGMIWRVGEICENLIDKIYDTVRDVGVRHANDTSTVVRVNDPAYVNEKGERAPQTRGDYQVSISTGPSFNTEREAASSFADTLVQNPEVFKLIGPLVVKLKHLGPIGDEISKALEFLQPPQLRAEQQAQQGEVPSPQQIGQMKMQLEHLTQLLAAAKQAIETDQAKQQAVIAKAQLEANLQIRLQEMRNAATIQVAKIAAFAKGAQIRSDEDTERIALGVQAEEAHRDRVHEALMAERGHEQALEQADQTAGFEADRTETSPDLPSSSEM